MSRVDIRHVSKRYGTVTALDDVSLELTDGEFFGLLGPSGSGKTTLLRSIAGFIQPEAGQILIDDQDIGSVSTHRRDIGMVFQNYALFPHMSVFDNIAFGLECRRIVGAEAQKRVAEILELVQLPGYERRRPKELSGGQQQRIALARALVSRPRVLLLDEPLGALDRSLRQQMQVELRQIQREVGITTVLVTHDQEEALTLSDRIAIFREGKVIQVGTPEAIYEHPRTSFAAKFMGAANFLSGLVTGSQGRAGRIRLDDGQSILTLDPLPAEGTRVDLAVRPEKFNMHAETPPSSTGGEPVNLLQGRVLQPIYLGASITYRVAVGSGELAVFQQNRDSRLYKPGDTVWLSWSAAHSTVLQGA
jgi:spermidine/putrescine transport system ATP-binding protein